MKAYGGVAVSIHVFLTSQSEVSGQLHAPAAYPREKSPPGTHWIGVWVDPKAGPNNVEKIKF
jgi:hypothetical protein